MWIEIRGNTSEKWSTFCFERKTVTAAVVELLGVQRKRGFSAGCDWLENRIHLPPESLKALLVWDAETLSLIVTVLNMFRNEFVPQIYPSKVVRAKSLWASPTRFKRAPLKCPGLKITVLWYSIFIEQPHPILCLHSKSRLLSHQSWRLGQLVVFTWGAVNAVLQVMHIKTNRFSQITCINTPTWLTGSGGRSPQL